MKAQMKGICIKSYTVKTKKPNSALRKVVEVLIHNKILKAFIPGKLSNKILIKNMEVLLIKKRLKDCPGIKFRLIKIY